MQGLLGKRGVDWMNWQNSISFFCQDCLHYVKKEFVEDEIDGLHIIFYCMCLEEEE